MRQGGIDPLQLTTVGSYGNQHSSMCVCVCVYIYITSTCGGSTARE